MSTEIKHIEDYYYVYSNGIFSGKTDTLEKAKLIALALLQELNENGFSLTLLEKIQTVINPLQ